MTRSASAPTASVPMCACSPSTVAGCSDAACSGKGLAVAIRSLSKQTNRVSHGRMGNERERELYDNAALADVERGGGTASGESLEAPNALVERHDGAGLEWRGASSSYAVVRRRVLSRRVIIIARQSERGSRGFLASVDVPATVDVRPEVSTETPSPSECAPSPRPDELGAFRLPRRPALAMSVILSLWVSLTRLVKRRNGVYFSP